MNDKDPIASAAAAAAKSHPPLMQVATQDLAALNRTYPVADASQLVALEGDAAAILANTNVKIQLRSKVSERIERAEKHVNEQLSYGGIFSSAGPFGSTLEYRYRDGDLVDEIGQMRRLADALNSLADALESEAQ